MSTYYELAARGRRRLRAAGIPAPEAELDARLLLGHFTGWDAAQYFAYGDQAASDGFIRDFDAAIERRAAREPIAYISGTHEFWGLPFTVTPAVLIPRPETESIVEVASAMLRDRMSARVVDVGTGSGCLAVAIGHECDGARITAIDISRPALTVAANNVGRHQLSSRIRLLQADLLSAVTGPFDVIVSNPPYVSDAARSTLPPEVVGHEPHRALFAGADGLDAIRSLMNQAPDRLTATGTLIFEFGFGQADAVAALASANPQLTLIELRSDLQGIPRTAVVRRTASA